MVSGLDSSPTVRLEAFTPVSAEDLKPLLSGCRFMHDGHFPDLPQDHLARHLIADLQGDPEYAVLSGWAVDGKKKRGAVLGKPLKWDTQHFGHQSARLAYVLAENDARNIKGELTAWFLRQCRQSGVRHVAARCNLLDLAYLQILLDHGLYVVAVNAMLRRQIKGQGHLEATLPPGFAWASFNSEMTGQLLCTMEIEGLSSRFNADPRFNPMQVKTMYESWIGGLLRSHPGHVVAAMWKDNVAGFAIATPSLPTYPLPKTEDFRPALVNMIAVAPPYRGHGLGTSLLAESIRRLSERGFNAVYGQVSLRNPASFNAFAKVGFSLVSSVADLHWWNG